MATKHTHLTRAELTFWKAAFLAAELSVLAKRSNKKLAAEGVAHLAAEYALAAVGELRNVKNGDRS